MIDCHTHTSISPDGTDDAADSYRKACELGLTAVAVTEHCEANRLYGTENYATVHKNEEHFFYNYDIFIKSMEKNLQIKTSSSSGTVFINGIELGQATHDFEAAEKIISDERLDFTIGSMHELPGRDDFAFLDYRNENCQELLSEYFTELQKLSEWGKFDVLGHLTYPLRYMIGEAKIKTDLSVHDETITKLFKTLARYDKGIEINTSGLRHPYGKTFPDLRYLKLFRECGGKIISICSDAHRTEHIGCGINEGIALAREAGFEKIYYYRNHIPYGISI
jgi:histidinol-phosphatase (PHP family)